MWKIYWSSWGKQLLLKWQNNVIENKGHGYVFPQPQELLTQMITPWWPWGEKTGFPKSLNASETKNNKSRICANVISPFFPSGRASQCAVQIKGLISSLPTSYFVSSGGGLMDRSLHVLSWSEDSVGGAQGRCPYHRTLAAFFSFIAAQFGLS